MSHITSGIGHSPTQLAWQRFKQNRPGYYSLWVFSFLLIFALFAEFIANDKPLLIHYDDSFYVPVFKSYPETTFGGDFLTEADYSDPYVQSLIEENGWAIWPLLRFNDNTINYYHSKPSPAAPDSQHWLGTDNQARDVLARNIYGFRISVLFGFALTALTLVIGTILGAIQGYFGGKIDLFLQRFIEIWSSMPVLFILIILSNFISPNFWWLLLIMLLFSWTGIVDLVRAEFLRGRNMDYIKAAQAMAVPTSHILFKHLLPNAMVASLTFLPFMLTGAIGTLTTLDFLGFGLPPGTASLGELLAQGKENLHAPWLTLTAFITLTVLLSLLVFIGSALRDAFDTRVQHAK